MPVSYRILRTPNQTTLTNNAATVTLGLGTSISGRDLTLVAASLITSSPALFAAMFFRPLRDPALTVTDAKQLLKEGWLRGHTPNVGTVGADWSSTVSLSWEGRLPLREENVPIGDAALDGQVMNLSGANADWLLEAVIEVLE